MTSEAKIQGEIYRWYNNTYCLKTNEPRCLIFSVPNGGTRNHVEATQLKATGLLPGVSDLIVIHATYSHEWGLVRRVLFIEVKTETGKQTPQQIEFQERIKALGYDYHVVRSLDQFKAIVA